MEKQPAKINYFFKGGYVEFWNTLKTTFLKLEDDIASSWDILAEGWEDFWENIGDVLEFEWDTIVEIIKAIFKFSLGLSRLIFVLLVTTSLSLFFSLIHMFILLVTMVTAYSFYMLWLFFDIIYCVIHRISSNCPNCQNHFSLPIYICPRCGAEHTKLRPSKYGIWKRTCDCGYKLPTTFFNGREKLESHCPNCGQNIKDGGKHIDLCIPVIGGPSSGKTCLIHQSISTISQSASGHGLHYEYLDSGLNDYEDSIKRINQGYLPEKTNEMRLKYYQFYLSPLSAKVKTLVSLCDVGGEVYSDSSSLGEQIGYKYANGFLLVVDPLSISAYRDEVQKSNINPAAYGYSNTSIDEIISMLIATLENMFCIGPKDMLKTNAAVVFSKCDIPGLLDEIGDTAVKQYIQSNPDVSYHEAQNAVCEAFLKKYDEINFLNSLKSKFKTIQFFCSSSLGHNANGCPFEANGVEEPIFWILSQIGGFSVYKEKEQNEKNK